MFSLDDANDQEILAFHWHPDSRSSITHPHLHISAGARVGYAPLQKAHVPSGHVALQEVLRFAITDLGVEPLIDRDEAMHLLIRLALAIEQPGQAGGRAAEVVNLLQAGFFKDGHLARQMAVRHEDHPAEGPLALEPVQ
jgi:hypothetical protein